MRTYVDPRPTGSSFARRRAGALAEGLLAAILIALLAGLTGWTAFTAAAPEIPPGQQTLEGILDIRHGDDFTSGRVAGHAYFLQTPGRETELVFEGTPPDDSLGGARVRVHGARQGERFLVAAGGTQNGSSPSSSPSVATGAKRVAVVLVNFSNDTSQPYTPSFAAGVAFTNANSVAAYYTETSWGQLTLTGEVFGWYTIPDINASCATSAWAASATTAAASAGVDLTAYDFVTYAFPTAPTCYWAGMAQTPGRFSWLNGAGAMTLQVMAHELGHNLGTHHASALNCTEGGVRVSLASDTASCTTNEYGDPFTLMGQATQYEHSNYSRGNFGWLQTANTVTVNAAGDYTLNPVENGGSTAVQALQIARTSGTFFTVEFRQPQGLFDTFPATMPVATGVSIRITAGYIVRLQSRLVDATPATTSFMDAPLLPGRTLVDPLSGVSITTLATSSSGATVRIAFGPGGTPSSSPAPSPSPEPSATPAPSPTPPSDAESPTTPTDLVATLGKGKKLDLSWSPSLDNIAVVGYGVYRDGTRVGMASGTTFRDTLTGRRTSATYWVVAFDAAGNSSATSQPITVAP